LLLWFEEPKHQSFSYALTMTKEILLLNSSTSCIQQPWQHFEDACLINELIAWQGVGVSVHNAYQYGMLHS
jgi:hypothetical protein